MRPPSERTNRPTFGIEIAELSRKIAGQSLLLCSRHSVFEGAQKKSRWKFSVLRSPKIIEWQ
jgi:hypothetical protein